MKYLITLFILSCCLCMTAQPPQLLKYQGIARDSTGNPVSNDTIALRISIHQGTLTGTVVYRETHSLVFTNQFGAFSINIGGGTVNTGIFSTIPWGRYNYFQEVEMDVTGGNNFVSMGTSQYLSVPYALAADSALHGIAPFVVQNLAGGNGMQGVAIAAIGNTGINAAPSLYVKNNSLGTSLYAESGNGIFILGDSSGLETNGNSLLGGKVRINDSLHVSGPLVVNGNSLMNNNLTIAGTLIAPIITATQGSFSGGISTTGETVNGNSHITGNLQVDGSVGPINGNLVNGTQGSFSVSLTTGHLAVNGSGTISGDLNVGGVLSKGGGSFKIDHPLDPANKFLYHSFVESPDMKNMYDGTVITDADGKAIVELPAYFEALNKDFRYQLTAIGQFAQAIVLEEISNNKFIIKTDRPDVKISWQVTGIRKDAFAEKHRIVPEVEKDKNEKEKYLYPYSYEPNKN